MDAKLAIDASGAFVLDDLAQEEFSARAGSYVVGHTSPDWLVLIRSPAVGDITQKRPAVVLAGDCGIFPLSDLIAFLGQSRWSGVIRQVSPTGERSLAFKGGEVRWAQSDIAADRIGEMMIRLGYVTKRQVEDVLKDTPPSRVGRALVERGALQAHDLFKCLTEQVSEIFHGMLLCKEGAFVLIDQDFDEKAVHTLNLSTQNLLMDSIRKIDEMAHFRKRIPHGRLYVIRKRASDGKLEPEEDQVLSLCTGQMNVLELGKAAKLSEFDATRVVYRLLEGGYAAVSPTPAGQLAAPAPVPSVAPPVAAVATSPAAKATVPVPPPAPPADDLPPWEKRTNEATNIIRVFNFIFREIQEELSKEGKQGEFLMSANAAMVDNSLSSSPVMQGLRFEADGSLVENDVLARFEKVKSQLGSEPLASLKQALSDVMFFLLFQAGELLEQKADEDLARRVKELLGTLETP